MIKVFDKWVIDSDGRQYSCGELGTMKVKVKNEAGEEELVDKDCIKSPMYHTTFIGCLQALSRRMRQKAIKDMDGTLENAIAVIQAVDKRLMDAMGVVASLSFDNVNEPANETVKEPETKRKEQKSSPEVAPEQEKPKRGRPRKSA